MLYFGEENRDVRLLLCLQLTLTLCLVAGARLGQVLVLRAGRVWGQRRLRATVWLTTKTFVTDQGFGWQAGRCAARLRGQRVSVNADSCVD